MKKGKLLKEPPAKKTTTKSKPERTKPAEPSVPEPEKPFEVEVRRVALYGTTATPYSGKGLCIVLDKNYKKDTATLMYPPTLEVFTIAIKDAFDAKGVLLADGIDTSSKGTDLLWPNNMSDVKFSPQVMAQSIRRKAESLNQMNRTFDSASVAKVLAALEGRKLEEVSGTVVSKVAKTRASMNRSNLGNKQPCAYRLAEKPPEDWKTASKNFKGQQALLLEVLKSRGEAYTSTPEATKLMQAKGFTCNQDPERAVYYYLNEWTKKSWLDRSFSTTRTEEKP